MTLMETLKMSLRDPTSRENVEEGQCGKWKLINFDKTKWGLGEEELLYHRPLPATDRTEIALQEYQYFTVNLPRRRYVLSV